jgi:hypothetical protein
MPLQVIDLNANGGLMNDPKVSISNFSNFNTLLVYFTLGPARQLFKDSELESKFKTAVKQGLEARMKD